MVRKVWPVVKERANIVSEHLSENSIDHGLYGGVAVVKQVGQSRVPPFAPGDTRELISIKHKLYNQTFAGSNLFASCFTIQATRF